MLLLWSLSCVFFKWDLFGEEFMYLVEFVHITRIEAIQLSLSLSKLLVLPLFFFIKAFDSLLYYWKYIEIKRSLSAVLEPTCNSSFPCYQALDGDALLVSSLVIKIPCNGILMKDFLWRLSSMLLFVHSDLLSLHHKLFILSIIIALSSLCFFSISHAEIKTCYCLILSPSISHRHENIIFLYLLVNLQLVVSRNK